MNHYLQKNISTLCLFGLATILSGCASLSSEFICKDTDRGKKCNEDIDDGIVYYMPQRPIRFKVDVETISGKSTKKVSVSLVHNIADTTPDLSRVFLLRYRKNYVGENHADIKVNNYGLLTVTSAKTTSKINEIANNIAMDVAAASLGFGVSPPTTTKGDAGKDGKDGTNAAQSSEIDQAIVNNVSTTCEHGSYNLLINPKLESAVTEKKLSKFNENQTICGVSINIKRGFQDADFKNLKDSRRIIGSNESINQIYDLKDSVVNSLDYFHPHNTHRSLPGLFYKQDLPYIVTIEHGEAKSQFIAQSPNESKIYFAPITKTLFSDNKSDITLENGVVTHLEEDTDSEILALTKMPSEALGAYTDAIGNIFSGLGASLTKQTSNITAEMTLLKNIEKMRQCQVAIATNNITVKTGDELTKALAAISTACSS